MPEGSAQVSELRKDPIVSRWVTIAPRRAERPSDFSAADEASGDSAGSSRGCCPFCPGNEELTTPEVLAFRFGHAPESWQLRVVPNLYPALEAESAPEPRAEADMEARLEAELVSDLEPNEESKEEPKQAADPGPGAGSLKVEARDEETSLGSKLSFECEPGFGVHEVVVESREHDTSWGQMSEEDLARVFVAWRERLLVLAQEPRLKAVQIFKNRGEKAGASIFHPHSQIVALPLIPPVLLEKLRSGQEHFASTRRCIWCELVAVEEEAKERLVESCGNFVTLEAWAPRTAFETWILPRKHGSRFEAQSSEDLFQLARATRRLFAALDQELQTPDLNVMLHTAPLHHPELPYFHWHLEVVPTAARMAGLEQGAGVFVSSLGPEEAAKRLRNRLEG